MRHPTDQLAEYAAGTLSEPVSSAVADHLSHCVACQQDVRGWQSVAEGVRTRVAPAPASVIIAVRSRLAALNADSHAASPPAYPMYPAYPAYQAYQVAAGGRPVMRAAGVLAHQWRLVGWRVWGVAAAVLVAGTALAGWISAPAEPVLAVVVPLVAALAVAGACGEDEPSDELVRATPTSERTILLARLTLVLGTIFAASVIGSLGLSLAGAGAPGGLLAAWLGPMVLLSSVSFAFSVVWRPTVGLSVALVVWMLRVLVASGSLNGAASGMVEAVWQTSLPVLAIAGAVMGGVLAVSPHLTSSQIVRLGS